MSAIFQNLCWHYNRLSIYTIFKTQTFDTLSPLSGMSYDKWKKKKGSEVLPNQIKNYSSS